MEKEMTKKELMVTIAAKVKSAKPQTRKMFMGYLKYRTKPELKKINQRVKVLNNGNDIKWD